MDSFRIEVARSATKELRARVFALRSSSSWIPSEKGCELGAGGKFRYISSVRIRVDWFVHDHRWREIGGMLAAAVAKPYFVSPAGGLV